MFFLNLIESENGIFNAILSGQVDFSSDPWPVISPQAKDLVRKMLNSDPKQRLTAAQVLSKHPQAPLKLKERKKRSSYFNIFFVFFLLFVKIIHGLRRMEKHQMFLLTMQ